MTHAIAASFFLLATACSHGTGPHGHVANRDAPPVTPRDTVRTDSLLLTDGASTLTGDTLRVSVKVTNVMTTAALLPLVECAGVVQAALYENTAEPGILVPEPHIARDRACPAILFPIAPGETRTIVSEYSLSANGVTFGPAGSDPTATSGIYAYSYAVVVLYGGQALDAGSGLLPGPALRP